ncbi:Intraflagellar transport protein 81 [Clydaea vesicula]|uniref:Intraflagellar transport protein 81 n=1 Tax=Clydaea vesicula TaxID=447962 RepID=A0AAD5U2U3_9FUNG|nr:Intraflagellar transport protein 81 [Clydaea vesicula]
MSSPDQLKFVASKLANPPYNKTGITAISLHDDLHIPILISYVSDIIAQIDSKMNVDLTKESFEDTVLRLSSFLSMLNYKPAENLETFTKALTKNKKAILESMYFLLNDFQSHQKRSYLAPFLVDVDIPPEFMHDNSILELQGQLQECQENFKNVHKLLDSLKQPGASASSIKREIQQMEEEKQQVLSKIYKLKKKVEQVPNHEIWLEAAKKLRLAQNNQLEITDRIKEQKNLVQQGEQKILKLNQNLKETLAALGGKSAELILSKMEQEHKMNKYLAMENLPKQIGEIQQKVDDYNRVLREPTLKDSDVKSLELEVKNLNDEIVKLAETRMEKSKNSGSDKLSLFVQQASIIARKKEGTAQKYRDIQDKVNLLITEHTNKRENVHKLHGSKMLKGDDFKKYVSDLREKSSVYKKLKSSLNEIQSEYGILQRTEEILKNREKIFKDSIENLEKKKGVLGFNMAKQSLEKVSEKKSDFDEKKGQTLNEISTIIQNLMKTVDSKKVKLAPIIQELRSLRQTIQELEGDYSEKKKSFDAMMAGLDSEAVGLDHEVKGYKQEILNDQSRFFYLNTMIKFKDVTNERVMQEMKAYIGGDDVVEAQQRVRGFKTYRDVYNKKIQDLENVGKSLRETQKEIKSEHTSNLKQLEMFQDLKKFLNLKLEKNLSLLKSGGKENLENYYDGSNITQDRLVL